MSTQNPVPGTEKKPAKLETESKPPEKKELTQEEKDQIVADGLDWFLRNDMPSKDAIEVCGEFIAKLRGQKPPEKAAGEHHHEHNQAVGEPKKK